MDVGLEVIAAAVRHNALVDDMNGRIAAARHRPPAFLGRSAGLGDPTPAGRHDRTSLANISGSGGVTCRGNLRLKEIPRPAPKSTDFGKLYPSGREPPSGLGQSVRTSRIRLTSNVNGILCLP
jgi:hypothetical protein